MPGEVELVSDFKQHNAFQSHIFKKDQINLNIEYWRLHSRT